MVGVLALTLCATVGLTAGGAEAAKKKKKTAKSKVFTETMNVNAPIPDAFAAAGPSTPVRVNFTLGKKFKNKVVGDVDLTFQTTGNGPGAASDLSVWLTAPNGRTVLPFETLGDVSIGPLTLDDDTTTSLCDSATPTCANPNATLIQPFAGRANTMDEDDDARPLSTFDGVRMKGTWTFMVYDNTFNGDTSVLNLVGLRVASATPVQ